MKALQANPMSIGEIFGSREFIIPEFQRPYSWGVEQCEQLWEDISSFFDDMSDDKDRYFLGSIVVYDDPESKSDKVWMVIDGQQRLTTLLILMRLLFQRASTHRVLEKMIYKTDSITTDILKEELRLETRVLADDRYNLSNIMELRIDKIDKKNKFRLNFNVLQEKLDIWWNEKTSDQRENALKLFRENVVMLPIVCDSLDDALTLFQIINDRGMSLNDADIFKAQIYGNCGDKEHFINTWRELDKHETLFRIHMHIIRADRGEINKERKMRSYIQDYFTELGNQKNEWDLIVHYLKGYHAILTQDYTCADEFKFQEQIYRKILHCYPNDYCHYPLYVFLNKYGDFEEDGFFYLADDQQSNYIKLLKNTVRYFYIKGVVHNSVNHVRDTTFKVCSAIAKENDYFEEYRSNVVLDIPSFKKRLEGDEYGVRYRKGMIWLCSSLNSKQDFNYYAEVIGKCEIEHILPWKWANYDGWDSDSHKKYIEKIGNKIPLEKKINIRASAEFFQRKQKEYESSKIQDALDLSTSTPCWTKNEIDKRQRKAISRFNAFFSPMY